MALLHVCAYDRFLRPATAWLGVVGLALLGGCAGHRRGVLGELPAPVFSARTEPRPLPRPSPAPRPTETRGESAWRPAGGISGRWECIVLHHSATPTGCAARFDLQHKQRGWDGLGYHFVIGNGTDTPDGRIEVGRRWLEQKHGAHCKTPDGFYNQHGIGICLVGNFEHTAPTPAQMESLARLARFLIAECGIPIEHVYTHGGVTGHTLCPGRRFPVAAVKRRLAG